MNTRKSEFQNESPNPAKRFIEWNGKHANFSFYDKEKSEKVEIPLPFKFLVLKEMHTVKGWNDASESGIFANEVKFIGQENLIVKSFKGGVIAEGLYSDIRNKIKDAGGHYSKSLYVMLEDGSIVNVSLKGSGVAEWGEFTKKSRKRLFDEWVTVEKTEERKKGSIKYQVPIFKYDISLTEAEGKLADEAWKVIEGYIEKYNEADVETKSPPLSGDDLDYEAKPIPDGKESNPDLKDLPF